MKAYTLSQSQMPTEKRRKPVKASRTVVFIILLIYAICLFLPFYIVIVTSLTSKAQFDATTKFIAFPKISFEPYKLLFSKDMKTDITGGIPSIFVGFFNTLWMTLVPLIIGLIVSGLSAYAFTKLKYPGQNLVFRIAYVISLVPLGAFGVISYLFFDTIGWTGSPLPLIVPGMFGSMGIVFFLKMYFEGIPNELLEAAKVDGMNAIKIYFKIVMPLALPAFIAQFLFGFVSGYNNYLGPSLYLQNASVKFFSISLQLVLVDAQNMYGQQTVTCAAAIIGLLPLVIIYAIFQRFFIEGIAMGGVKE